MAAGSVSDDHYLALAKATRPGPAERVRALPRGPERSGITTLHGSPTRSPRAPSRLLAAARRGHRRRSRGCCGGSSERRALRGPAHGPCNVDRTAVCVRHHVAPRNEPNARSLRPRATSRSVFSGAGHARHHRRCARNCPFGSVRAVSALAEASLRKNAGVRRPLICGSPEANPTLRCLNTAWLQMRSRRAPGVGHNVVNHAARKGIPAGLNVARTLVRCR